MNLRAVVALCILALVTAGAHGQTLTTGQISGTVTDPSGAVVPKAQVAEDYGIQLRRLLRCAPARSWTLCCDHYGKGLRDCESRRH